MHCGGALYILKCLVCNANYKLGIFYSEKAFFNEVCNAGMENIGFPRRQGRIIYEALQIFLPPFSDWATAGNRLCQLTAGRNSQYCHTS